MTMIARSAATRAVSRVVTSQQTRCLSTKEPKLHMAKGRWGALKAKRPIDHDEEHLVFHTPFNKLTVVVGIVSVVGIGWGSMAYGCAHQQYKQGFWK